MQFFGHIEGSISAPGSGRRARPVGVPWVATRAGGARRKKHDGVVKAVDTFGPGRDFEKTVPGKNLPGGFFQKNTRIFTKIDQNVRPF